MKIVDECGGSFDETVLFPHFSSRRYSLRKPTIYSKMHGENMQVGSGIILDTAYAL